MIDYAGSNVLGRSEYASEGGRRPPCSLWRTKKRTRGPRFKPGFCGGKEKERLLDLSFFYVAGPGIEPGTS